MPEITVRDNRG